MLTLKITIIQLQARSHIYFPGTLLRYRLAFSEAANVCVWDKEPIDVLLVERVLQEITQGYVSRRPQSQQMNPGLLHMPSALSPSHPFADP